MEEIIAVMTGYNAGENWTPRRISRTGVDGSTPVTSRTRDVDDSRISDVCLNPHPCAPSSALWNNSIVNIQQNTTPNLRDNNEFNAPVDKGLTNDPILMSVRSQIPGGELSDSSSRYLYSHCQMNFSADTVQPVEPQFW